MIIDEHVLLPTPLNIVEPSPASLSQHIYIPTSFGQQTSTPLVRDSRRGEGVIDDLTINVEGMAIYRGMALERLDHYVNQLLYMYTRDKFIPYARMWTLGSYSTNFCTMQVLVRPYF